VRKKIELVLFWILVLALAIWVFFNFDFAKNKIEEFILLFGYPAVLVLSMITEILEQPIGPEVPSILAILFGLSHLVVILLAMLGSVVGSLISFYVGRRFFTARLAELCSAKKHLDLCKLFHKYGRLELVLAAITPLPYVSSCWLAGAFKMQLRRSLIITC
jgi:membrane protein YqaA with SNARE-associated domain